MKKEEKAISLLQCEGMIRENSLPFEFEMSRHCSAYKSKSVTMMAKKDKTPSSNGMGFGQKKEKKVTNKVESPAQEKRRSKASNDDIFSMVEQAAAGRISRPDAKPLEPEKQEMTKDEPVKTGRFAPHATLLLQILLTPVLTESGLPS
eukprot:761321-Hanusia_phi.AAC.1